MEQLKGIKVLGMNSDGKDKLMKFRERTAALKVLESAGNVFDEELAKLQGLERAECDKELFGLVDSGSFRFSPCLRGIWCMV